MTPPLAVPLGQWPIETIRVSIPVRKTVVCGLLRSDIGLLTKQSESSAADRLEAAINTVALSDVMRAASPQRRKASVAAGVMP